MKTLKEILLALSHIEIMALTLWAEARSESMDGRIAVACIISNRAKHPGWWGTNIRGVCLKRWQFSCWIPQGGAANHEALVAMARRVVRGEDRRLPVAYRECLWIVRAILNGDIGDKIRGCNHYYVKGSRKPKWAIGKTPKLTLGQHLFFKAVGGHAHEQSRRNTGDVLRS